MIGPPPTVGMMACSVSRWLSSVKREVVLRLYRTHKNSTTPPGPGLKSCSCQKSSESVLRTSLLPATSPVPNTQPKGSYASLVSLSTLTSVVGSIPRPPSGTAPTATRQERYTGHIAGIVGGQENGNRCDFLRGREPTQRSLAKHPLAPIAR